jgi:sugar lactone lactonase YvrE
VVRARAQTCQNASPYDQCSSNIACGCLPLAATNNNGVCVYLYHTCSELNACANKNQMCYQPGHVCVKHPRCQNLPVCYPIDTISQLHCPATPSPVPEDGICATATWNENGVTVAGGHDAGDALNQLYWPDGLFMDDNNDIYIIDTNNNRVMKYAHGALSGQVVAGGNGEGNKSNQLWSPRDIAVDKNGTLFICDQRNSRVQRWFKDDKDGETIISNIECFGLAIDTAGFLYVSDFERRAIIKWPNGQIVAGGNGDGQSLNQFSSEGKIFVDRAQSIFVADGGTHRITKWPVGAKEGIVVAGGNGYGSGLDQFADASSVIVDRTGTVYVSDLYNHRVMRWFKGAKSGIVIAGGKDRGDRADQLYDPADLAFDQEGNLYVSDGANHRVQMFSIDKSTCAAGEYETIVIH